MCTYTEFSFLVKLFSNVPEQRSFSIIMYKICRKKKIKVHFRFLQRNRIRINFVICRAPLLWYIVKYIIIKRIVLYYCVCQNVFICPNAVRDIYFTVCDDFPEASSFLLDERFRTKKHIFK